MLFAVNTDLSCYLVNSDIVVLSALLLVLSCFVTWSRERLFLTPRVDLSQGAEIQNRGSAKHFS